MVVVLATPALAADEIHWTMIGPTAVSFDWRGTGRTLRYGLTKSYGLTATGEAPSILPFSSAGPFQEAKLTGLQAGATYHYSLDGGPDHTFHALPVPGTSFTVFAEGDIGSSLSYRAMAPIQARVADGRPSFVLAMGDLSYADHNGLACVDQHFNDVMTWSQDAAYMPIWGNHDWADGDTTDDLRDYKGRFDLPNPQTSPGSPSVSCCGEDWYWFDAGNVRFIAYPEQFPGAWAAWKKSATTLMDQAQADPAFRFIVTFGHRPAYSSGIHPGSPSLRAILDTLGAHHDKYVLNLNGHSHDYERTTPRFGVTHVTVGIGGSTLEPSLGGPCAWAGGCPPPAWSAFRAYHHGVLRLQFEADSIRGDVLCGPAATYDDVTCPEGTVLDQFTLNGHKLSSPPASALALRHVRPNPVEDSSFMLDYTLADAGEARLELLDVAGRSVHRIALNAAGAGPHEAQVSTTRDLRPGIYWLRLTQSGHEARGRVVLLP
jgi:hypothetical protein